MDSFREIPWVSPPARSRRGTRQGMLGLVVAVFGATSSASPAFATLTSDNTNIGSHPSYGSGYSALWRTGFDYAVLTSDVNTYINAPSANGQILFRAANDGTRDSGRGFCLNQPDADGWCSRAFLDTTSTLHVGGDGVFNGSIISFGYDGHENFNAAITGDSSSTSAPGVLGISLGDGIEGQAASNPPGRGVYGHTGWPGGYGVYGEANGNGQAVHGENTDTSGYAGLFNGRLKVVGQPLCTTQATFTVSSDARLKKNVRPLEGALDQLLKLRGVTFEWRNPADHGNLTGIQRGFIAQDVEKVLPEWVETGSDGFKALTTRGIEAMLVESVRALKVENDELRGRVAALERGNAPKLSSVLPFGVGSGLVVALVPLGAVVARRRRAKAGGAA